MRCASSAGLFRWCLEAFLVMAGPEGVLQKVLKLKEWLSHTQDPPKVMKALKRLQVLEISLDTLLETGVGKIVNSFRKHHTVGNLAKSLICHWKKLVPQGHSSESPKRKGIKGKESSTKIKRNWSLKENKHLEKSQISTLSSKTLPSSVKQKKLHQVKDKQRNEDSGGFLSHPSEQQSNNICQNAPGGLEMNSSKHIDKELKERHRSSERHSSSKTINKNSKKSHSCPDKRKDSLSLKAEKYGKAKPTDTGLEGALKLNSRAKSPSDEDFEPPTMSFESYLNYDLVSSRKKRKACPASKQVVNSNCVSQKSVALASDGMEEEALRSDDLLETPTKKAKTSLQDLLNTPLPKLLPEISLSSPPYVTEFKAPPAVAVPQQRCDAVQFTGRRLNSKMQVYSGSKTVYLSKMLTLYEQCIRVLQNNIDSLHEVDGVPFEILEPVLTHCTSEQLFRIEDYNPTFIEQSDHLWKKHCQRDFRNEQPMEYESWREMHLRVFNEREEKLKSLTRSILSAQSENPKGQNIQKMEKAVTFLQAPTKAAGQHLLFLFFMQLEQTKMEKRLPKKLLQ
ncbi:elongin-A-like isoform X2 [Heteronotia binoei]|uniref:elongin-A-like isoform X2 n=1 Tax=Heteronotia binoei TaxID=13085 RepID=UPI0029317C86|nr:elongin-A-like isoform X2 [Heteronotia binoei]